MLSILVPCSLTIWDEELALAKKRDADGVIRFNQTDPHFHEKRCRIRHASEGYIQAIIETTIHGWRLRDTLSPGGQGTLFNERTADALLKDCMNWIAYNDHHRELVVAYIVPSRRDEFQRALNRVFQYIF
jgi:hypothetical protein